MSVEQLAVGLEPAEEVLRQLHAVDAPDELPVLHEVVERLERAAALWGGRRRADVLGVRRQRGDERRRFEIGDRTRRRQEVVDPSSTVEPAGPVGGEALDELLSGCLRQRAKPHRRRERRVVEVDAAEVRARRPEASGDEAQVVVLHEHDRAVRAGVADGVGEEWFTER